MVRSLSLAGLLLVAAAFGATSCKEKSGEMVSLRARILAPAGVTDPYGGLDAVRISVVQGATTIASRDFGLDDVWTIPEVDADLTSPIAIRVDGLSGGVVAKSGRTAPFLPREARPDGHGIYFAPVGAWAPAADVPDAPRVLAAVTTLGDGRVVIAGGSTSTSGGMVLGTLEIYDPEEGDWRVGATLAAARANPMVIELVDGRLLVAGGLDANGVVLASAELVTLPPRGDLTTPAVVAAASDLPHPWFGMQAARLPSGKIVVAGGFLDASAVGGGTPAVFDPGTATWSTLPNGIQARGASVVRLDGGRVAIIGGGDEATFRRVDLVSEETGAPVITPGPDVLRVRRYGPGAIAVGPARILVTGGAEDLGRTRPTGATELVDVASNGTITSTFAERDDDHLSFRSSTSVRDGLVLLAGGLDGGTPNPNASAVLFDVATSRYFAASDLPVPMTGRRYAVPLPDGTMLFAGADRRTETLVFNPPVVASAPLERADYTITLATASRAAGGVLDGAATMRVRVHDVFSQVDERTFPASSTAYTFEDFAVGDDTLRFVVEAVDAEGETLAWGATVEPVTPDGLRSGAQTVLLGRVGEFNLTPTVLPSRHGDGGAALLGGRIAIAGGLGGESATDLYDPTSGATSALTTSTLPTSRREVRAVKLGDDRLFVVGGVSAGLPTAAASMLTLGNDGALSWSAASPLPTPVVRHSVVALADGTVVVDGSQTIADSNASTPLSFAARWNGSTWATPAPAATPTTTRGRHQSVVLGNGTILLAGGVTTSSGAMGPTIMATDCETLDPLTLSPAVTNGCLATPRRDFVAFSTTNGGAVVCGGVPAIVGASIATCERYNPTTRTFTAAGSLTVARDDSGVATLDTGASVIAGGVGPGGLSTTVDLFDGTVTLLGNMRTGRAFPAVVPLPDGRIVILGGTNTTPNPDVGLDSVEVWTPAVWKNPYDAQP